MGVAWTHSADGSRSIRKDTVLFLSCPEEQKLCFQGEKPLRCASRLLPPGSRKVAGPVSAPPAQAPSLCAGAGPVRRLGLRDRHSSDTAHQHTQQDGRAAPATPATGLRRPPRKTETQEQPAETGCRRCGAGSGCATWKVRRASFPFLWHIT